MIRRLWKTLKLGFDRSFSGASWKQITWLFGILALVLGFSLWIKSYCTAELHDMRILELLLDPGSFVLQDGDPLGYERLPLLALTFLGAIFLSIVAAVPLIVGAVNSSLSSVALGGTSVLILVGVALETVRQLESQLMMRNYKGFLE